MKFSLHQIELFQQMIFSWWENNKRDLPWRHTRDPYAIHISEVMLQQTQVSRVLPAYQSFLQQFPTVYELASCSTADVLRVWKGMGYNRRALYLKQSAQKIVQLYSGVYPKQEKHLLDLPGLGIYTARAILVFAYECQLAFVDTNIKKIIEYYFFDQKHQSLQVIQKTAELLLPKGRAWDWHQALMDYGSSVQLVIEGAKSKKAKPFKETNRYIRGKLMDMVREKDWNKHDLMNVFITTYDASRERVEYNINTLVSEGLLACSDSHITLPD